MAGAQVAISTLPASAVLASADIIPFVRSGVTDKITLGNFRTQMFAFASADPLLIGALTAVGNSSITGTLSGITTLTATTGVFTSLSGTLATAGTITSTMDGQQFIRSGASIAAQFIRLGNTGTDIYFGAEGSTSGGFWTNSNAYAGVIQSSTELDILIGSGSKNVFNASGATLAGTLVLSQAASKIVPGATSLSLRNNANSADNLLITDAGVTTIRAGLTLTSGPLTFSQASQKIALPSGSGIDFRTASDAGSAFLINDTGLIQISNGQLNLTASSTAHASLLMPSGTAPTSPADGQMWYDGANIKFRIGGTTKTFTVT